MAGFFPRGTMKPPLGAQVDPEHPLARGLVFAMLFQQPRPLVAGATYAASSELITSGSAVAPQIQVTGSPTWVSNRDGLALRFDNTMALTLVSPTTNAWLPNAAITVAFIRRRASSSLGVKVVNAAGPIDIFAPWTDGTVYWDFGGSSSPNRLTVSGLAFDTTTVERWVFTGGPQGSAIWRNGTKLASQSTAISRTSHTDSLGLNNSDYNEFNFLQMHDVQWSDDLCRWWSVEPYAHFYAASASRRFFLVGNLAWQLQSGQKALMYALGNVARGGATRGQYHDARVYVAIDGTHYATARTDDTTRILDGSLTITDVVDNTPNTCRFATMGFIPTEGQEIIITLGSKNNGKRLFGGQILRVGQSYVGTPANFVASVDAIDYSWRLNRRLALRRYTSTSASTIAADLIASFTTGLTAHHIQAGLDVLDEITFTNQTVSEALTQLAKRVGGYWYIDYLADLHLYVGTEAVFTDPTTLTPTHPTLSDFAATRDLSQFVTRVYYEGGGVNALTEVAAGETILPVDDAAWYSPTGGVVTTGQQRVIYTSTDAGNGGSLVGPGIGPAAAPSATMAAGAGVDLGAHDYAVTFVTGSGESLPSPRLTLTVANVTPPAAPTATVGEWIGTAIENGVHTYAVTCVTAAGETTSAASASVTHGPQAVPTPTWSGTGVYNNLLGGSLTASSYYGYVATFVTATGETVASNRSVCYANALNHTLDIFNIPVSPFASVTARKLYRTIASGNAWTGTLYLVATISDNTTTNYSDTAADSSISSHASPPTSTTATYPGNRTDLSGIALGPSGTTARKLYRTVAGGSQLKLLGTIYDNSTTTWTDSYADATLGSNIPTVNTAPQAVVNLAAIPIGGTGVTSRGIYRTAAGGSQLKLVDTLADNTTTTYSDTTADGSLGADVPTGDTSGLTQPAGQVNAGSTTLAVAGPAAFNAQGGWAIIGNGQQIVRYTGLSGTMLTGVPASGLGAITATITYNSTVTAAPALLGIPASGTGAILYTIKKGDPINLLAQVDDAAAQAVLAALVGGDGVQETYLQDRRLSLAEATARATAALAQRNQVDIVITFKSRDCNTGAGRTISVNLPAPMHLVADFTIQSVSIGLFSPNILPTYEVRAASTQFSGDDLLRLQAAG